MYGKEGYKRVDSADYKVEIGKTKIVVYATHHDGGMIKKVTHGAIQYPDGTRSSKLGEGPQIRHTTPDALNGPIYGKPVAVYVK